MIWDVTAYTFYRQNVDRLPKTVKV